jgi:hypothetical protein
MPSLLFVPNNATDLGIVDAGELLRGTVALGNFGEVACRIQRVSGISLATPVIKGALLVRPADVVQIPYVIDFHGMEGKQVIQLQLWTSDRSVGVISYEFAATVVSSTDVRPYRNTVIAERDAAGVPVSNPIIFDFLPGAKSGSFSTVMFEDPGVPLLVSWVKTASGGIHGEVTVDASAIMNGAPVQGETRLLGETVNGNKNFITLQWWVKEGKREALLH